jgi:hypothetical protein
LPGDASGGRGSSLATDGAFLYFVSGSRVFRVPVAGGAPEALTPAHAADGAIVFADGFLYWTRAGVVTRMAAQGGAMQPLVEVPSTGGWTVSSDGILWWESGAGAMPLMRTAFSSGETSELWPGRPEQGLRHVRADREHAYLALDFDLFRIPIEGGSEEHLAGNGDTAGDSTRVRSGDLLLTDTHVYFGGTRRFTGPDEEPDPPHAVFRLPKASPHTLAVVAAGYPVQMFAHHGALFVDVVTPELDGAEAPGEIVRVPLEGGEAEHVADSDSRSIAGAASSTTSLGLVATDCFVYFNRACHDESTSRVVAIPDPVATD